MTKNTRKRSTRSAAPKANTKPNRSKTLTLAIIVLGALISLGILVSTTSTPANATDTLFTMGFYVWVALPFALLWILTLSIYRKPYSRAAQIAILITSLGVSGASGWAYWTAILGSKSSTSALVFVFVPLYSIVAGWALYLLAWLLIRFLKRERRR